MDDAATVRGVEGAGEFAAEGQALWRIVGLVIVGSVLLHGVTAGPVIAALDRARERKAREETGSERGSEDSYYEIWNRLPRETRDYVPLMVAAARISKEPARYGFDEVEIEEPLIEWMRDGTVPHGPAILADARASVVNADIAMAIAEARSSYDLVLLDVDNGPDGIVRTGNERLYTRTGLARARDALTPGGLLAVWSAAPDPKFTRRLKDAGFEVEERVVRARPNNKGPRHTIWFARKPPARQPASVSAAQASRG